MQLDGLEWEVGLSGRCCFVQNVLGDACLALPPQLPYDAARAPCDSSCVLLLPLLRALTPALCWRPRSCSLCRTAEKINAGLIIVMVQSGRTVSLVSKYRPPMPIMVRLPGRSSLVEFGGAWTCGCVEQRCMPGLWAYRQTASTMPIMVRSSVVAPWACGWC